MLANRSVALRWVPAWVVSAGFLLTVAVGAPLQVPSTGELLRTLKPAHPRLIVREGDFERMLDLARRDPVAGRWLAELKEKGERLLGEPVSRYEIPDGLRLLSTSRRVLDRVYLLSLLERIDPRPQFKQRLWAELAAAAAFPDWNPRHFLDTAEMSHAFAIALDWLYDEWSPEERRQLTETIMRMGLDPALAAYEGRSQTGWWTEAEHNWNQVCNGGIGIAALAIAETEPELAATVLHQALTRLPRAIAHYGPDGAWNEGPGYWHYATRYTVYILAALETALGSDFGLSDIDGFAEAGWFPIYLTGPTGRTFNFGDGEDNPIRGEEMFWLARRFQRPEFAAYQVSKARPTVLDLLWYDPTLAAGSTSHPPLDRYYRKLEGAVLRSDWNDQQAMFVGFKAGDNGANHSNLDVGSFVLEALGERWILDLGRDDYNMPGYFSRGADGRRWTYYRMRAEGHNTLVLAPGPGPDQDPLGAAPITDFTSEAGRAAVTAELASVYPGRARRIERRLELTREEPALLVEDRIRTNASETVWWFAHTEAEVTLSESGRTATLALGSKRLLAEIEAPAEARFEVLPARPLPSSPQPTEQDVNEGIRKLAIRLEGVEEVQLRVRFRPLPAARAEHMGVNMENAGTFVHTVFFWLKPGTSAEARQQLIDDCQSYLGTIPTVRYLSVGLPAGTPRPVVDNSFGVGLSVHFDDREGHDIYQAHAKHVEFIERNQAHWERVQVYDVVAE